MSRQLADEIVKIHGNRENSYEPDTNGGIGHYTRSFWDSAEQVGTPENLVEPATTMLCHGGLDWAFNNASQAIIEDEERRAKAARGEA